MLLVAENADSATTLCRNLVKACAKWPFAGEKKHERLACPCYRDRGLRSGEWVLALIKASDPRGRHLVGNAEHLPGLESLKLARGWSRIDAVVNDLEAGRGAGNFHEDVIFLALGDADRL